MTDQARIISQVLFVFFWLLCAATLGVIMSLLVFQIDNMWLKSSLVPLIVLVFAVLFIRDHYRN